MNATRGIKNGELINDFPLFFYLGACGLGVLVGWWSYWQWRFNRATAKTNEHVLGLVISALKEIQGSASATYRSTREHKDIDGSK
ncbi:MAG: hypothetical protein ABI967_14435 [bacterium]